jgi:predicted ATPase
MLAGCVSYPATEVVLMLIEFRVSNFRSFQGEQTLSLVANSDKAHPGNLISAGKFKLLKAAAVYGANASGKSNLVRAVSLMEAFVHTSATMMNLGDIINGVEPFRLDAQSRNQPSRFEVTVLIHGTRYVYGFRIDSKRVHAEWLNVCRPGGRLVTWFDRQFDTGTQQTTWDICGPLKKDQKLLREKTRDNGLLLSRAAELNLEPVRELFLWYSKNLWIYGLPDRPTNSFQRTAQRMQGDKAFHDRVFALVHDADLGIAGIELEDESIDQKVFDVMKLMLPKKYWGELKDVLRTKLKVRSVHPVQHSQDVEMFDFESDESNGTQRFFALVGPILEALDEGHVVFIDEIECSMHPLLTRKLVELFLSRETNPKGAQLVFATHDSTLMDHRLLRRDQLWFTEKTPSGATDLFSLHDFRSAQRPRNTESFARNYLAGRYGAVPSLGPALEDVEVE